jgi:hypothetical protein
MRGGYDGFLMKVLLGLLSVPTMMAPVGVMFLLGGVIEVPSDIPLCFDLRVKTQTGDPGHAMVAYSHVIPFLEALLWRSLV